MPISKKTPSKPTAKPSNNSKPTTVAPVEVATVATMPSTDIDSTQILKDWADWALSQEDNREYTPFDVSTLIPIVTDLDSEKLKKLIASKKRGTIEVQFSESKLTEFILFLRSWIRANGKNRDRRADHYLHLAQEFRLGFIPEGTNFVVDENGMVNDGGHSSVGLAIAFFPPNILYGLERATLAETDTIKDSESGKAKKVPIMADSELGKVRLANLGPDGKPLAYGAYIEGTDGKVYDSKSFAGNSEDFKLVGEHDSKGRYIEGTDDKTYRSKQDITIRVTINTPANRALKLAETRLPASLIDYINSVGSLRELLQSSHIPSEVVSKLAEILRSWYYRVNHNYTNGVLSTYGYVSKGGKPTLSDGPVWFLSALGHLMDTLSYLKNSDGKMVAWGLWRPVPNVTKGGISLANGLTAMMVSDNAGKQRIADLLTMSATVPKSELPEGIRNFLDSCVVSKVDSTLSNDIVIESLVLYGLGHSDMLTKARETKGEGDKKKPSWQDPSNRSQTNWDNSDDLEIDDTLSLVQWQTELRAEVNKMLGQEGKKDLKATRKGKGVRGANKA